MFKQSDNPALFKAVCNAYTRQFPEDKSVDSFSTKELSDEQLSKITSLKIEAKSGYWNVTSLSGIENLTNLTEFSFNGQSPLKYASEFDDAVKRSNTQKGYDLESQLAFYTREYESGQIDDITPIYSLKMLKKLELKEQRKITSVDFSNNPNLTNVDMTNCTGLKSIKGLEQLHVIEGNENNNFDIFDSKFEFSGCCRLSSVENIDKLVDKLDQNEDAGIEANIFLPTTTYCHISREDSKTCEHLANKHTQHRDYIHWTEIGQGNVRIENTSPQMNIAKRYADDTIRTIFKGKENVSSLDMTSGVYRWICDNITYDTSGLEDAKSEDPKKRHRKADSIRSSYTALIDKKAVCVGVSNLFNFMMADLGFTAEPCACSTNIGNDSRMTVANHRISKVHLDGKPYYCDPTWDLGSEESQFFCLSKEEMEKTHQFNISEHNSPNGPSFQKMLKNAGLLESEPQIQMW